MVPMFKFSDIVVLIGTIAFLISYAAAIIVQIIMCRLRHFKLEVRYYQENPTFRIAVNVSTVFGAGAFGALLSMHLLNYLGRIFWPAIFH